jgi:hypothetical protein
MTRHGSVVVFNGTADSKGGDVTGRRPPNASMNELPLSSVLLMSFINNPDTAFCAHPHRALSMKTLAADHLILHRNGYAAPPVPEGAKLHALIENAAVLPKP